VSMLYESLLLVNALFKLKNILAISPYKYFDKSLFFDYHDLKFRKRRQESSLKNQKEKQNKTKTNISGDGWGE